MSVVYEIREHLVVSKETELSEEIKGFMIGNISILAALKIQGIAEIYRAVLSSEKHNIKFINELTLEDMKTLADGINDSDTFELTLHYEYTRYGLHELSHMAGPWELTELLDVTGKKELDGVFYSMWNTADCEQGNGILCAYGEKNGKFYNGVVEPKEVKEFPKGAWYTYETVLASDEIPRGKNEDELLEVFKSLSKYSITDDLRITDDKIDFYLSNLSVESEEVLKDIISNYKKVKKLTGELFILDMPFTDSDAETDMRLFNIEFDDNLKPKYLLREV